MNCSHARHTVLHFRCLAIWRNLYFLIVEYYKGFRSRMSQSLKFLDKCTICNVSHIFFQISCHCVPPFFQRINLRMRLVRVLGQHESANIDGTILYNYKKYIYIINILCPKFTFSDNRTLSGKFFQLENINL